MTFGYNFTPRHAAVSIPADRPPAAPIWTPAVRSLLREAAERYGVTVREAMSKRRYKEAVAARAYIAWRLRAQGMSLPLIGQIMDRDHSTVLFLIRKHALASKGSHRHSSDNEFTPDESGIWAI